MSKNNTDINSTITCKLYKRKSCIQKKEETNILLQHVEKVITFIESYEKNESAILAFNEYCLELYGKIPSLYE